MHHANAVDLCFLPVTTRQQIYNMLAFIQIQKELRKVPRVEGFRICTIGSVEKTGVCIQLAVLSKKSRGYDSMNERIDFAVRVPLAFPAEAPLISCTAGGEKLPQTLFRNGRLNMSWLQGGWQQEYTLHQFTKDLCSALDTSSSNPFASTPEHSLHDAKTAPPPAPSAPIVYAGKLSKDASRQMLLRCKWNDTIKQFHVPMLKALQELRQVIALHLPAAMQPGVSLKFLKSPSEAVLLQTDEDVRWLCASNLPIVYIHLQVKEQQLPVSVVGADLLGLNRLSPKKPHETAPGSPARVQLSPSVPVASTDLLGLDQQFLKKFGGTAPSATPVRPQHDSLTLKKILKPGYNIREVEWKDLAIQKHVGTGSSCQVYKGSWRGAEVAVKTFTGLDRSAVEREFANEVDMMQQLGPNPSLVLLLAVCANPLSLVLEYLPFSLFELINGAPDKTRQIPPFPSSWTKRVSMMLDVARGLQFLHSFNIIHRDLKSLNLLMTAEGRVKLADFGISRSNDQSQLMTGCCGTFQWMAPEVLTSHKYSLSADVYSFAIIMWEICEGAAPFKDLAPAQIPIAVVHERRRPMISSKTPPPLRDLIQQCWQHNPALRPTAAEVGSILQGFFPA